MVLPLVGSNIIYCLLEYGLLLKIFKPICFHNDWDVVIGHLNHIDLYGIPAQSIERASSVRGSRRRHTAERAIDITDIPASFFSGILESPSCAEPIRYLATYHLHLKSWSYITALCLTNTSHHVSLSYRVIFHFLIA